MLENEQDINFYPSEDVSVKNGQEQETADLQGERPEKVSSSDIDFQEQVSNVALGTHAQVHNHNPSIEQWFQIIKFFEHKGEGKHTDVQAEDERTQQDPLVQKLSENFDFDMQDTTFVGAGEFRSETRDKALPQTTATLTEWYYGLSDYEQCFVLATAVLHGTHAQMVSNAAGELYNSLQATATAPVTILEEGMSSTQPPEKPLRISSMELQARTYTTVRRVRDGHRLFWQDTDRQGVSLFGLRIFDFIVEEANVAFGSRVERHFLEQLEQWSERFKGEALWRAVRALGIAHWLHSVDQFRRRANAWADSDRPRDWQCAASYLAGIYETAQYIQEQQIDDPRKSVLWLLDQWVQRLHTTANVRVGCAAARFYGLIGRRDPETALHGLNKLLYFEGTIPQGTKALPEEAFNEGISHYVSLVWSGHIRLVLKHLASHAQLLAYPNHHTVRGTQPAELREPREMCLKALCDIFGLVSAASFSSTVHGRQANYSLTRPLPERPRVPDEQGKDILLAGVLADEEQAWRAQLSTLLSAMILIRQEAAAFLIMRKWAEVVLLEQLPEQEEAQTRLIEFLARIGMQVHQYCQDNTRPGYRPLPIANLFKRELLHWQAEGRRKRHPIELLAQEVAGKLTF